MRKHARLTELTAALVALLLLLIGPLMLSIKPLSINVPQSDTSPQPSISIQDYNLGGQTVKVYTGGEIVDMPLEEYVVGVVAAEMPAVYPEEALKAQAVAARTLVVSQLEAYGGNGCGQHDGADVCADYGDCQAFIDTAAQKERWGTDYNTYAVKIAQAVMDTAGEIITYEGSPITVFYHSMSVGETEDAQTVFSENLPYYQHVSSEADETLDNYQAQKKISKTELVQTINNAYSGAKLTENNIHKQLKILSRTQAGRVDEVLAGSVTISGIAFRKALSLNSTDFTISFEQDAVIFTTRGSGHGVGMSQVGARMMALEGDTYRDILLHYYPLTEIDEIHV